ncbi:MAG TPA: carbohydrate porin [Gemmataceae bacterium]|jgi:high affinity Mn2+ porin|nr:carbohydrate porin [Gemmataceae bacterium]
MAKDQEKEDKAKNKEPWYSVHEQGTIVTQEHDHFRSPYVGPNSLLPVEPSATSETATLFLDARLWECGTSSGELVFNPEISGGRGFSGTLGLAGFPNGEISRVGESLPTPYIARLFWRETWGLGGEREKVEDDANQIAGIRDRDRVTLLVGKMSATDVFDNNRYSHDPRTQFLNWSIMYNGAWDYPANVRGYDYGVVLDLTTVFWAVRYGIFAEPKFANSAPLDPHIAKANGQILEFQENYRLVDCPGVVREWVYLNHAHMGNYREALAEMPVNPDITLTRAYRFKYGFGANLEQELTKDLGAFIKVGWNDGQSESWAFTEIDETVAVGLLLKGKHWRRPNDVVGVAAVVNGLSRPHRDYLAAGGLGFIIGDGRLNYGPEEILETYYDWQLVKGINVALDFQGVNHPAYNRDRGPVAIGTIRVHVEH